jgi:hypothetical protein
MAEEQAVDEAVEEELETEQIDEDTSDETTDETQEDAETVEFDTWRDLIQDSDLQKHAERFNSVDDLVQANLESRKKLSKSVTVPGKNASDEDLSSYREALGVPVDVDGYEFPLEDGVERTEEMMDAEDHWSNIFLDNNIPKETADVLVQEFKTEIGRIFEQKAANDETYAKHAEETLRREWEDDYDKNIIFASRASEALLGDDYEDVRHLETTDGKYMLDHPLMVKMFAKLGREMGEGALGSVATEGEKDTLMEQANSYREKRVDAYAKGNHAEARKWDEKERLILDKLHGGGPIVGSDTRTS